MKIPSALRTVLLARSIRPYYADALEARRACAADRIDGGLFWTL